MGISQSKHIHVAIVEHGTKNTMIRVVNLASY